MVYARYANAQQRVNVGPFVKNERGRSRNFAPFHPVI